jgi:predicted transcriptional regulator
MKPLTVRQAEVYAWLLNQLLTTHHWPTVRELGAEFGFSMNAVQGYYRALVRKGWLAAAGLPSTKGRYRFVGVVLTANRIDGRDWPDVAATAATAVPGAEPPTVRA